MLDNADQRCTWTLFEEPYWLDAVAPGTWDAVEIKRDGQVVGRLPYATKRRYCLKAISMPRLTPWIGPWIRPAGAKLPNELSHQHQILETLLEGLPKAHKTLISCAPEFQNLMALYWAGCELGLAYTYRLTNLGDEQHLWNNMRDTVRRLCRKAEKVTAINRERDLATFISVMETSFVRRGMDMSETLPGVGEHRRNDEPPEPAYNLLGRRRAWAYSCGRIRGLR